MQRLICSGLGWWVKVLFHSLKPQQLCSSSSKVARQAGPMWLLPSELCSILLGCAGEASLIRDNDCEILYGKSSALCIEKAHRESRVVFLLWVIHPINIYWAFSPDTIGFPPSSHWRGQVTHPPAAVSVLSWWCSEMPRTLCLAPLPPEGGPPPMERAYKRPSPEAGWKPWCHSSSRAPQGIRMRLGFQWIHIFLSCSPYPPSFALLSHLPHSLSLESTPLIKHRMRIFVWSLASWEPDLAQVLALCPRDRH